MEWCVLKFSPNLFISCLPSLQPQSAPLCGTRIDSAAPLCLGTDAASRVVVFTDDASVNKLACALL